MADGHVASQLGMQATPAAPCQRLLLQPLPGSSRSTAQQLAPCCMHWEHVFMMQLDA